MALEYRSQVRIERRFEQHLERVFDAWLDPALLARWLPTSTDEAIVRVQVDPRVGKSFSFHVLGPSGPVEHVGRYLQINRPFRLKFTWGIAGLSEEESRVTVDLQPHGTGCDVTVVHQLQPQWASQADRTEADWNRRLDGLASVLGTTPGL